jgi:hypothetical protein
MRFVLGQRAFAVFAMAAAGCTASSEGRVLSSEDALVSSSPEPFDVTALAPRAKATFHAPSGATELCIVAGRFVGDGYTDADANDEDSLCRIDWNAPPDQQGVVAAGLTPSVSETTPATDIQQVTRAAARDVIESLDQANAQPRPTATLARLRTSLDAARFGGVVYAPSILGYYGTSRILGRVGQVPPAVWRTLEVTRHQKVADNGAQLTLPTALPLRPLWATFAKTDEQPAARDILTYTTDRSELYGAFSPARPAAALDHDADSVDSLTRSDRFRGLIDPSPVSAHLGRDIVTVAPTLAGMQGVVEMLVLDAILLDKDRFRGGRVHSAPAMMFRQADGSIGTMAKSDYDALGGSRPLGAVQVSELTLLDTGGGLAPASPDAMRASPGFDLLGRIAHIAPDLYTRVQQLRRMVDNPELGPFVQSEWRFTQRDWLRYREMAIAVATLLHDRCSGGALRLDLDVAAALAGTPPSTSCDLP